MSFQQFYGLIIDFRNFIVADFFHWFLFVYDIELESMSKNKCCVEKCMLGIINNCQYHYAEVILTAFISNNNFNVFKVYDTLKWLKKLFCNSIIIINYELSTVAIFQLIYCNFNLACLQSLYCRFTISFYWQIMNAFRKLIIILFLQIKYVFQYHFV